MDRETFINGITEVIKKTNMPNGNGIDIENICKDFALLAYDEALILHSVSNSVVCGNCDGYGHTVDENGRRKEHCKECE